jgi:predicted 2-oxoglutarate/Fe(II)-dependent dioxygenase YbiX/peroxiredoxin
MTKARPAPLGLGEAAPWFRAPVVDGSSAYAFDTAGGRAVLMLFFGSAGREESASALARMRERRDLFDDSNAAFFGISVDPADVAEGRIRQQLPGLRFFLDYDFAVSRQYGADAGDGRYRPHWLLLDRRLRVAGRFAHADGDEARAALAALATSPAMPDWAPVAMIPNVFEPDLCRKLIALYEENGGEESGFMRDVDGMTRLLLDPAHKVRRDFLIEDQQLAQELNRRILRRLVPQLRRSFQFSATRVERLLVACYEAESGGHFAAHRDNTTKGTAHRRFAVTINLNEAEYEGGDLVFPEYGQRAYRAPTGGAVVFSCSLLHRAMPVTRGRRFAFLPFLYDEAGAKLREENARFLEGELANYRAAADVVVRDPD